MHIFLHNTYGRKGELHFCPETFLYCLALLFLRSTRLYSDRHKTTRQLQSVCCNPTSEKKVLYHISGYQNVNVIIWNESQIRWFRILDEDDQTMHEEMMTGCLCLLAGCRMTWKFLRGSLAAAMQQTIEEEAVLFDDYVYWCDSRRIVVKTRLQRFAKLHTTWGCGVRIFISAVSRCIGVSCANMHKCIYLSSKLHGY